MFYLDHEEQVKFVDGVLAHSQEWQWLIDIIGEKAEFKDIDSWGDFVNERIQLQTIYEYFVKIISFCDREWEWPQVQIQQLWLIAQFYLEMISMEECVQDITDISCTLFLFCVWITKLENVDNETDYLLDIRLLCQRNCYEIIKCNSLQMSEDDLMNYANEYFGDHLEVPIDCLCDNIEHKKYLCDINFLQQYETAIMNYNCFGYRSLPISDCTTWQEEGLLDLLKISIRDRQVVPMFSGNGRSVPDVDSWTEGSLLSIKDFFRNDMSDFLVETVLYVLLQIEPSQKVKLTHCKLLTQALEAGEDSFKIANSSSYAILSYLHADHMMKDCNDSQEYITLIKLLQEEKDPEIILQYSESGYPLKREQKGIVKDFLENKYKAMVRKETKEIRLGNYCKNITLGHLTQLFPVLEIRIRELVKLFGIFPFKKNKDEFMQYNDPSSLLRELLKQIYVEQQGFDNVPDLLYVYNIMYNSNSYNIRNECVHGRDYLEGNSLHFAFRATLMAIAMVNFRIKTIQDNVSDIC